MHTDQDDLAFKPRTRKEAETGLGSKLVRSKHASQVDNIIPKSCCHFYHVLVQAFLKTRTSVLLPIFKPTCKSTLFAYAVRLSGASGRIAPF